MLSRAEVIAAYRAVLGRDPESEQEIERRRGADLADLGRALIDTDEFDLVLATRRRRPDERDLDGRLRDLEARVAAVLPAPHRPDLCARDLEAAIRRAEAAELRCADLASQLLHQPPPEPAAPRGAAQPGASQPAAEQLRAELAAMRASTSWRLTAPLRAVVRRVRR